MPLPGVYINHQKNNIISYRSSITYKNKHISLGSFDEEDKAHNAYLVAKRIINDKSITISECSDYDPLRFDKLVSVINLRDNGVYLKNPIYLSKSFFSYYLSKDIVLRFDIEDLFYYSEHRIQKRGNHLFVADYGMQLNLLSRYGIRSYSVVNRDYRFINGDKYDFRYENIEIINRFVGVRKITQGFHNKYKASILVNGRYSIGIYDTEIEAAIAYNKAADIIKKALPNKKYQLNYFEDLPPQEYVRLYTDIIINQRIIDDFSNKKAPH